jgi:DNA-binding FrmR family transcriptional regulator
MEMDRERVKLVNRAKRIHGQMERVERSLIEDPECANVLMLLAAVRGGIDGLRTPELGEELIDLVRAYMK